MNASDNIALRLINQHGCRDVYLAHITGAHINTVEAWIHGTSPAPYYKKRLERLLATFEARAAKRRAAATKKVSAPKKGDAA